MQHDLVRFKELWRGIRDRRVIVISAFNSALVLFLACALAIFFDVLEKRRAHAEMLGAREETSATGPVERPRAAATRTASRSTPTPPAGSTGAETARPEPEAKRDRSPRPSPRGTAPPVSTFSVDALEEYPVEIRERPSGTRSPTALHPGLEAEPIPELEEAPAAEGWDEEASPRG